MTSKTSVLQPLPQQQDSHFVISKNNLKRRSWSLSSESSSYSLPFKKRRFVLIPVSDEEEEDRLISTPFALSPIGVSRLQQHSPQQRTEQRETLVTTPIMGIINPVGVTTVPASIVEGFACITPVPSTLDKERKVLSQLSACNNVKPLQEEAKTTLSSLSVSLASVPMQTRWSSRRNSNSSSTNDDSLSSLTSLPRKRPSHPKLNAPLPDGCHGKTSRTQSFCRRGPNYKGSNYCKLHFFDPRYKSMIAQNDDSFEDTICPRASKSSSTNVTEIESPSIDPAAIENKSLDQKSTKRAPRDKLYRGSTSNDGGTMAEVRCLAISTRGRRCCYAAVALNGERYCHRHSSFFVGSNNPNPDPTPKKETEPKADSTSARKSPAFEASDSATTPPTRRNRSSSVSHKASVAASDLSRPPSALSDLSTDLWQNRKVLVSKGPHKSKIATVVRWRNGWVTVELSIQEEEQKSTKNKSKIEVFHNRRSYELFLV